MSRTQFVLKAPEGAEESTISGTFYFPDEKGEVTTNNAAHVKVLELHGYKVTSEVSILKPMANLGLMNTDEMGLSQLRDALSQRGLVQPDHASRDDMVAAALAWNQSRRGRALIDNAGADPIEVAKTTMTREQLQAALDALDAKEIPPARAPIPAPDPAQMTAAQAAQAGAAPTAAVGRPDFSAFKNAELKGWLASNKVDFKGNASTDVLIDLASKKFDEIIEARRQASAQAA